MKTKFTQEEIWIAGGMKGMLGVACGKMHETEEKVLNSRLRKYLDKEGHVDLPRVEADNDLTPHEVLSLGLLTGMEYLHSTLHIEFSDNVSDALSLAATNAVTDRVGSKAIFKPGDSLDDFAKKLPMDMPEELKDSLIALARAANIIKGDEK